MSIERIGIVGAGTMGSGIAQSCAVAGLPVTMVDVAQSAVDRGLKTIDGSLERLVKKEKLAANAKAQALGLVATSLDTAALKDCDLVIEAATENLELKLKLFAAIERSCEVRARSSRSNTSSISITRLAAATRRPDRVIGMHFFNPVPVMQLVELIRGLQTSDGHDIRGQWSWSRRRWTRPRQGEELARLRREPDALPDD